jgi:hypothetical protein
MTNKESERKCNDNGNSKGKGWWVEYIRFPPCAIKPREDGAAGLWRLV